jgi:hypothetical protein
MVSGMMELKLTIYLGKRNQTLMVWEESNKYSLVRWLKIWGLVEH